MDRLIINKFNLEVIDLTSILRESEHNIEEDLYTYDLFPVEFNKDTVSLAYHHLIINICDAIRQSSAVYKVITYTNNITFMTDHLEVNEGRQFILKTISKFKNLLPIIFWEASLSHGIMRKILESDSGERIELEYHLNKFTNTRKKSLYSFNKLKKFGDRYGLQFLTKNFFEKVENKQLILG